MTARERMVALEEMEALNQFAASVRGTIFHESRADICWFFFLGGGGWKVFLVQTAVNIPMVAQPRNLQLEPASSEDLYSEEQSLVVFLNGTSKAPRSSLVILVLVTGRD